MDEQPEIGTVEARDDGTLWRWVGAWEMIEPLRRRARNVHELWREFGGRYVVVACPGRAAFAGFADGFEQGAMVHQHGRWPIGPESTIAGDCVGRRQMIERLIEISTDFGRDVVVKQLDARVATLDARFQEALAGGVDVDLCRRLNIEWRALKAEADLAAGRTPEVTPTNLGS